ncbi:MAG: hypothetical protein K6L73_01770 [Cellvibrionaceae bacterium]
MFRRFCILTLLISLHLSLSGCDSSPSESESPSPGTPQNATPNIRQATNPTLLTALNELNHKTKQNITRAKQEAEKLQSSIDSLLASPFAENLENTRQQWLNTYLALIPLAVQGEIGFEQPALLSELRRYNTHMDAWPIQPGFIDYFDVYTQSGLVNDTTVIMKADALLEQHGILDPTDVAVGMQAMAYLLFGENGQRPLEDFVIPARPDGMKVSDTHQARRRAYVSILIQLLKDDLRSLHSQYQAEHSLQLRMNNLLPDTRKQLWHKSVLRRINHLLTEWQQALLAEEERSFRNPSKSGITAAWCAELESIAKISHTLKLNNTDHYTRAAVACLDNKAGEPTELAKILLERLAAEK